jgi:hypothetical protein
MNINDYLSGAIHHASHIKDVILIFLNHLEITRLKFGKVESEDGKNIWRVAFDGLERCVNRLNQIVSGGPTWLTSSGRCWVTALIMCILCDRSSECRARVYTFLERFERLTSKLLDYQALMTDHYRQHGFDFSFYLHENVQSSSYVRSLLKHNHESWLILQTLISGEKDVSVTYIDDHLTRPSECALIAQILFQLKELLLITLKDVQFILPKGKGKPPYLSEEEETFEKDNDRVSFLTRILGVMFQEPFSVVRKDYADCPHTLCLRNSNFAVEIITRDGLTYPWTPLVKHAPPSVAELLLNPLVDMECINILAQNGSPHRTRILVTYKPAR